MSDQTPPLSPELTRDVLNFLGVEAAPPSVAYLDMLITAYTEHVPWESAFRIAKRARTANTMDCPRFAEEFWHDALHNGGGGTCFESNYAFFSLLRALGYEGYLTINNMSLKNGCHTAIHLTIDGEHWLADAGFPVYAALPLDPQTPRQHISRFHTYTVYPLSDLRFDIIRDQHPVPYCFTVIDKPVSNDIYRAATTKDYGVGGLFLDRVIVNKVIDGQQYRFNTSEPPPHIQAFAGGERYDMPISGDVAAAVAQHFGMDETTLRAALNAIHTRLS